MKKELVYDSFCSELVSSKAVVMIHGWTGNKDSMYPIVNSLKLKNIDWYLLEAPFPVEGVDDGFSWFYKNKNGDWQEEETRQLLYRFFRKIFSIYYSKNIYVIGFSQGGLVCIDHILFLDKKLGGIFPIAGFSRRVLKKNDRFHPCQKNTPILLCHGKNDEKVPMESSKIIYKELKKQGATNIELLLYNGKHKIGLECLRKIKSMISE